MLLPEGVVVSPGSEGFFPPWTSLASGVLIEVELGTEDAARGLYNGPIEGCTFNHYAVEKKPSAIRKQRA